MVSGSGPSFLIDTAVTHAGLLQFLALGPLTVAAPISATSRLNLLGSNITLAAGGTVSGASPTLNASGAFINQAGATAVTATDLGGRWLIYSANPTGNTYGGLDSGNAAVWNTGIGGTVAATGNRYVFALQPSLTVRTTDVQKTYGDDATATVAAAYTIEGLQPGIAGAFRADAVTGAPTVTSAGSAVAASVGASPYAVTAALGAFQAPVGYGTTSFVNAGQLTVARRTITASLGGTTSRVYDGTTSSAASLSFAAGQLIGSDVVTAAAASTSYNAATVAGANLITATGISLGGAGAGNYQLSGTTASVAGSITPRTITAGLGGTTSRVYDGTTASAASLSFAPGQLIGSDVVTATAASTSYNAATVAGANLITATGISLGGAGAGNYQLSATTASVAGSITPRTITASLGGTTSRVYDGTTSSAATLSFAPGQLIGSDVVTATAASTSYNAATVPGANLITATGISLGGAGAGNYQLSSTTAATAGFITPRTITASLGGTTVKTYDGTTSSAASLSFASGQLIGSDVVTATAASTSYNAATVAGANLITATGISLGGAGAGNYQLSATTAATAGSITPRTVTASLGGTTSRVYDGTTASAATLSFAAGQVIGSDVVTASASSTTYNAATVAGANLITATGISLGGAGAGNYQLSSESATAAGSITPRSITATLGGTTTKTYDGTTASAAGLSIAAGQLIGSDLVTASAASTTYNAATVAGANLITASGITLAGAGAGNYQLSSSSASVAGSITPAPLAIRALDRTKSYGDNLDLGTSAFSARGLVANETIGAVSLSSAGAVPQAGVSSSPYVIQPSAAGGGSFNATNYAITYTVGALVVTRRSLAVTADDKTRVIGAPAPSLTYRVTGGSLANSDAITGDLTSAGTSATSIGAYPILQGTLSAGENYSLTFVPGTLSVQNAPPGQDATAAQLAGTLAAARQLPLPGGTAIEGLFADAPIVPGTAGQGGPVTNGAAGRPPGSGDVAQCRIFGAGTLVCP